MAQQLTLPVRPGEVIRFPRRCAACGQGAQERMSLQKKRGQVVRRVDAPLCDVCAQILRRRSGEEERLARIGRVAAIAAALLLLATSLAVSAGLAWWLRLAFGVLLSLAGAAFTWRLFARRLATAALPEKKRVRAAARIVDFSWRDMTLEFADDDFARTVRELNTPDQPDEDGLSKAPESPVAETD